MRPPAPCPCPAATYQQVSGTSVSAALAAGAAGLVLAATANDAAGDMREVRDALLDGADVVSVLKSAAAAGGKLVARGRRLNAYNAIAAYLGDSNAWPWLPPAMCGVAPAGWAPQTQPPVSQRGGCGCWRVELRALSASQAGRPPTGAGSLSAAAATPAGACSGDTGTSASAPTSQPALATAATAAAAVAQAAAVATSAATATAAIV